MLSEGTTSLITNSYIQIFIGVKGRTKKGFLVPEQYLLYAIVLTKEAEKILLELKASKKQEQQTVTGICPDLKMNTFYHETETALGSAS